MRFLWRDRPSSGLVLETRRRGRSAGNSSKATTGIAAPGCELQKASGITDAGVDLFSAEPSAKDGGDRHSLDARWTLVGRAYDWMGKFGGKGKLDAQDALRAQEMLEKGSQAGCACSGWRKHGALQILPV